MRLEYVVNERQGRRIMRRLICLEIRAGFKNTSRRAWEEIFLRRKPCPTEMVSGVRTWDRCSWWQGLVMVTGF
jgi:hypothetical protein